MKSKCPHCGGAINPAALLAATQKGGRKNFSAAERKRRAARMSEARKANNKNKGHMKTNQTKIEELRDIIALDKYGKIYSALPDDGPEQDDVAGEADARAVQKSCEAEANARLIAAAPSLLAALEMWKARGFTRPISEHPEAIWQRAFHDAVNSAIARARGQEATE